MMKTAVLVAGVLLWLAGLRLFVDADLSRRRKLSWSAVLIVAGGLIGCTLPGAQVWNKFLVLLALLPLVGALDICLARSRRSWTFWVRACGFELGTVFGTAGATRFVFDRLGVRALLG